MHTQNIDGRIISDDDLGEVCRRLIEIANAAYLSEQEKKEQRDEVLDKYDLSQK
jgi:hypothetical protein